MRIDERRLRSGYSNLGPFRFPILPQPSILTDRADGTLWLVSWNAVTPTVDGAGRLSVNSTDVDIDAKIGVRKFQAFEGPVFGNDGEFSLFVRSGRIGVDFNPFPNGIEDRDDAPIYLRQKANNAVRQIVITGIKSGQKVRLDMLINETQQDG